MNISVHILKRGYVQYLPIWEYELKLNKTAINCPRPYTNWLNLLSLLINLKCLVKKHFFLANVFFGLSCPQGMYNVNFSLCLVCLNQREVYKNYKKLIWVCPLLLIYITFSSSAYVVGKEGKENEEKDPTPCGIGLHKNA